MCFDPIAGAFFLLPFGPQKVAARSIPAITKSPDGQFAYLCFWSMVTQPVSVGLRPTQRIVRGNKVKSHVYNIISKPFLIAVIYLPFKHFNYTRNP